MSTLVKLGIRINILSISAAIVIAVAVYGFGMGTAKVAGVRLYDALIALVYIALLCCLLQNLVFKPALSSQAARFAKQVLTVSLDEVLSAGQVSFMTEVVDSLDRCHKIRYRLAAIIAVVLYFVPGLFIGSPGMEVIALLTLLLAPSVITFAMQKPMLKSRELDPELYEAASNAYERAFKSYFDGRM